jgi:UDPglucose 6-dehydrogenase
MQSADALVIITEWNQFRALDLKRIRTLMREPVMIDLRNIYTPADAAAAGIRYSCVGRPEREPNAEPEL